MLPVGSKKMVHLDRSINTTCSQPSFAVETNRTISDMARRERGHEAKALKKIGGGDVESKFLFGSNSNNCDVHCFTLTLDTFLNKLGAGSVAHSIRRPLEDHTNATSSNMTVGSTKSGKTSKRSAVSALYFKLFLYLGC